MKRLITSLGLLMASIILPSQAAIISIVPQNIVTTVGEQLIVDLTISGLGDKQASSLSIFDIDLMFDSKILAFKNASFGDQLDLSGFGSWQIIKDSSPSLVNFFELSFDDVSVLDTLQAGSFVLVSMVFDVIDNGVAKLLTQVNSLGDANSIALPNVELVNASVDVAEPSIALIMALGLVVVFNKRRLRSRNN